MSQVIVRFVGTDDPEMLHIDELGREIFQRISGEELLKIVSHAYGNERASKPIFINNEEIIAHGPSSVAIVQKQRKRIVTYQNKAYNIAFPNSFYVLSFVSGSVKKITAFAFCEWEGLDTKLYQYPMPNMLYSNDLCMGTADKKIKDKDYIQALENITYAIYTHSTVNGIKSFKDTATYFEYLEQNDFPYHLLLPLKNTIKDYVEVLT